MIRKYSTLAEHPDTETELLIHYTFTPGCPEQGPSYASGGEPAEPPEIELDRVERLDDTPAREFNDWAAAWLAGAGFDAAVEEACEDRGPDPDDARDARMERERER